MSNSPRCPRVRTAWAWALFVLFFALGAEAAGPKRVLILHSFGRDFAPYDTITSVFRTDLAQTLHRARSRSSRRTSISGAPSSDKEERALLDYLRARFDDAPPDVVVTIGPPAARLYARHRAELFPGAPLVMGALDERFAQQVTLAPTDAVVAGKVDLPGLVENILQLLPETQTIAVVVGASELERFWLGELKREFAPFTNRVKFEWLNELSLAQMQERRREAAAALGGPVRASHRRCRGRSARAPGRAGEPSCGGERADLRPLRERARQRRRRRALLVATIARRAHRHGGASRAGHVRRIQPQVDIIGFEPPVYDWRELERWNIDPARLPPGSEIRFKPPSIWEEHRTADHRDGVGARLLQAALIAALLIAAARRRRAEQRGAAPRRAHPDGTGGRAAQARARDARRRDAAAGRASPSMPRRCKATAADSASGDALDTRSASVWWNLSEDVHALSYRLHPSVIEDLGLVAALQGRMRPRRAAGAHPRGFRCPRTSRRRSLRTRRICLFRVAQEALRNVVRHAHASNVEVSAAGGKDGGITLAVRDNGTGFE